MNQVLGSLEWSLPTSVLLSNTPQIIISFAYLFYNSIFTCMTLSYEYGRFATVRKPLRVSQPSPSGTQRSSFWLQLPYRYIIPVMAAITLLHWTVSRSLYLIQLTVYDEDGAQIPSESFKGCGFSPYPILFSLVIGAAMMIALLWLSRRQLEPTVPLAASCSLAISAATHAAQGETDAAIMPIQYGIVPAAGKDEEGYRRIGFSSERVEPLSLTEVYR
ncbi:hypothetical protein B0I35DRAFT_225134 [Stachybotrys elegans]|uniref:Uncharacterized protein n=1 Tax=Stachybotrys elegans TaxID=80388 RepID=A0A8K0WRX5_9HYPO|nr:hypothetical protein B0I35DRAFT_225134 [Stachybotrys elegans]